VSCLSRLQAEVSGHCGVTRFEFKYGDYEADVERKKADPDSRPSRAVGFTELDGNEKLRVLRDIDMSKVFHSREGVDVVVRQEIWSGFKEIYHHLSSWKAEWSPDQFGDVCKLWLETFLTTADVNSGHSIDGLHCIRSLDGNSLWVAGYHSVDVSPYIHALTKHAGDMKRRWGGTMIQFACFALERSNGSQQAVWHRYTNHGGGTAHDGDAREIHHARALATYRQIMLHHLRQTFNPSVVTRQYQCGHCAEDYDTTGWLTAHWISKHAPADFDKTPYEKPRDRLPLVPAALGYYYDL
jgi:hypothetical protein